MQIITGIVGVTQNWKITIRDSQGNTVTSFDGTELTTAEVWSGEDTPVLFEPLVIWYSAPAGELKLTISGAQTAEVEPGLYRVVIFVGSAAVWIGGLKLSHAPGAALTPTTWGTYEEVLDFAPWVEKLQDLEEGEAGFVKARGRARSWLIDVIIGRYGNLTASHLDGAPGGWGVEDTTWLREQLDTDGVLIMRDQTREILAKRAIAYICAAQIGPKTDNPYVDLASRFDRESSNLVKVYRAELDFNLDGLPDVVVNCGAGSLR